jgi:hypothetical protein
MALEGKLIVAFIRFRCITLYPVAMTSFFNNGTLVTCRCVEQINKASRGDLTPEELQERQVSSLFTPLPPSLALSPRRMLLILVWSFQAKGMQDPEIQGILTDPIMRQVTFDVRCGVMLLHSSFLFSLELC